MDRRSFLGAMCCAAVTPPAEFLKVFEGPKAIKLDPAATFSMEIFFPFSGAHGFDLKAVVIKVSPEMGIEELEKRLSEMVGCTARLTVQSREDIVDKDGRIRRPPYGLGREDGPPGPGDPYGGA